MERRFEDVSVADVAGRAGVATGLLFHYFGTKRGLFVAALEVRSAQEQARFASNTSPDPVRWLRKELDMFLANVAEGPQGFAGVIHGGVGAEADVQRVVQRTRDGSAARVLAKLGVGDPSPLLSLGVTTWAASANEMAAEWIESGRKVSKARVRSVLVATLNATLAAVAAAESGSPFDAQTFAGA